MSDAEHREPPEPTPGPSRRAFLRGAALGALSGGLLTGSAQQGANGSDGGEGSNGDPGAPLISGTLVAPLTINGQTVRVQVEPRTTLLDALRDGRRPNDQPVDITGAKKVCDRGTCGACTVLLDGQPVYACSLLALDAVGHDVWTVEGSGAALATVQQAFVEHDALMCGFCTPGFVVAATALLERNPRPTQAEIRHALDGNICRCGTYARIFEAVETAGRRLAGQGGQT